MIGILYKTGQLKMLHYDSVGENDNDLHSYSDSDASSDSDHSGSSQTVVD